MGMSLSKLQEMVKDKEVWRAAVHGLQRVRHDLVTSNNNSPHKALLLLLSRFSRVSDSVRPHRWQPTRLPRPWDSPGKNTGVGPHFLLQCMKMKSESEVTQSCPTLRDPTDCGPPGSSDHWDSPGKDTGVGYHSLLQVPLLLLLLLSHFSRV